MVRISYWVLPLLSGFVWIATLLSLLIYWLSNSRPRYVTMEPTQSIAYISDIGATKLKPLFIVGCCLTALFLDLTLISERWLRHTGRLARNTNLGQKVLVWLNLFFAAIGSVGLVLLSVFDSLNHRQLHYISLTLFIAGYILSAIFICWEYRLLGKYYLHIYAIRVSFWIKLVFIIIGLVLVAAFAANDLLQNYNTAAILEWIISLIFGFYVFSYSMDLLPATQHGGQEANRDGKRYAYEMRHRTSYD